MGDGEADRAVAKVGDEVESSAEGFDVAGYDFEGGHLAVLDLADAGDGDAHSGGDVFLADAERLAGFGELVAACLGGLSP